MKSKKMAMTFICLGLLSFSNGTWPQAQVIKNKPTALSGKIFRSDTNQPVAGATINIWNAQGNRLETKTNEKGYYSFEQTKPGTYKVNIHVRYGKLADSPCSVFGSRVTADKKSDVTMKDEGLGFVDVWVSMDDFKITAGKPNIKDFDVACKGTYRNHAKP